MYFGVLPVDFKRLNEAHSFGK